MCGCGCVVKYLFGRSGEGVGRNAESNTRWPTHAAFVYSYTHAPTHSATVEDGVFLGVGQELGALLLREVCARARACVCVCQSVLVLCRAQ